MQRVKFRLVEPRLRPRRTRLRIPGWAGEPVPRADGAQEYAWHCVPFSEATQYGAEISYPYDTEFRASTRGGELVLEGDFGPPPDDQRAWPPFRSFGEFYYTFQLLLDFKPEAGFAIQVGPHPRFFTDPTGTVPLAVPALIRSWWPMIFFLVFKAPPEGHSHVFRPGEPIAQFIFIPEEPDFELEPMSEAEAAERELQSRRIYASRATLGADSQWLSATNTVFDATYRRLHGAVRACPAHAAPEPAAPSARPVNSATNDGGDDTNDGGDANAASAATPSNDGDDDTNGGDSRPNIGPVAAADPPAGGPLPRAWSHRLP